MSDLSWMRPKLAELCGLRHEGAYYWTAGEDILAAGAIIETPHWRPDEDVAQAVRSLESLRGKFQVLIDMDLGETWTVEMLDTHESSNIITQQTDKSLPRAICLAIQEAMQWET